MKVDKLIDGRGVGFIAVAPGWKLNACDVPRRDPLYVILAETVAHGKRFPNHGFDCACMDDTIREVKRQIGHALPDRGLDWYDPATRNARMRVSHVLYVAGRML